MLILHFDYTSPASVVAVLRLQRLADQGAMVAFAGIDVLGLDATIPATLDQLTEVDRWAARAEELGLPLPRPSRRPPTLGAHLVATAAEALDLGAAWRVAVLEAYWHRSADLGDDTVLVELAEGVGLPGGEIRDLLADRARRAELRRGMAAERGRGVGGVPVLEFAGAFVPADLPEEDLRRLAAL